MDIVTKVFLCNLTLIFFCAFMHATFNFFEKGGLAYKYILSPWLILTLLATFAYIPYFFFAVL